MKPAIEDANSVMSQGGERAAKSMVHDLIARQAVLAPNALAISDDKRQLTFAELDQRANRLARHIQTLGIVPHTTLGLYFERSVDFVVAALATLKAGAAFLPLDAAYPPGRINDILVDAGVPVLLSHKWMSAGLAGGHWKTVDLDIDAAKIESLSAEPVSAQLAANDLAYVIYTSGSTGRSKGVEVTHANLLHLIRWHHRAFAVTPNDRVGQIAGLAFDAAVWDVWCNISAGASLHLIDDVTRRSPDGLKDWLVAKRITLAFVPTIMAEHLVICEWPTNTALRFLLTGADILHRHPPAGLPFVLVNNYGPTECTVLVTSGAVASGVPGSAPSLGYPIDDTEILIMDSELRRLTPGNEGEICVAGPQIARGYRNLPELTAERFVQEPANGQRIYRTGDRGSILPSGEVAFLGRLDDQIKIRGFRVEPGEIETRLMSHPQIRSAVVVARGPRAEEKSLVAYVVLSPGSEPLASELREYLQTSLPDYMIPASYVSLVSLPVTTTGKCDKEQLPAPTVLNMLPEASGIQTANQRRQEGTEARVAQLVSGLMGGRPIGRDDNFFLVGGNSMLAAQLVARVSESLAVRLNLRQLFEAPTISALAAVVDHELAKT